MGLLCVRMMISVRKSRGKSSREEVTHWPAQRQNRLRSCPRSSPVPLKICQEVHTDTFTTSMDSMRASGEHGSSQRVISQCGCQQEAESRKEGQVPTGLLTGTGESDNNSAWQSGSS